MDDDRRFGARLSDQGAYPSAVVVVMMLAGIVGLGLVTSEAVNWAPVVPPDPGDIERAMPTSSLPALRVATATPTPAARAALPSTLSSPLFAGLIGLPPEGAAPSTPEVGDLLQSYPVDGGGLPYRGTARLYADGRLIWNRYFDGPAGHNAYTTGYLEQLLSLEGARLAEAEKDLRRKDPLELLAVLPLDAWKARKPVPYVPSGYGICLFLEDPRPGRVLSADAIGSAELVRMLPPSVATFLEGRAVVSPIDWEHDCIALTTDETRALDRFLHGGGFDQNTFLNSFMVQYSIEVSGGYGVRVSLMFEPRFPDGSVGCSACG